MQYRKSYNATATHCGTVTLLASLWLIGSNTVVRADPQIGKWSLRPLCVLWDGQASTTIARRVTESGSRDIALLPIVNDLSRMQRARRNCDLGYIRAACQDYIAIMRNVGGTVSEWRGSASVCPPALADELGGKTQSAAEVGTE
jgi:hypothetical protein